MTLDEVIAKIESDTRALLVTEEENAKYRLVELMPADEPKYEEKS